MTVDTCSGTSVACEDYFITQSDYDVQINSESLQYYDHDAKVSKPKYNSLYQPTFDHKHFDSTIARKCLNFQVYSKRTSRLDTNHHHIDKLFQNGRVQTDEIVDNKKNIIDFVEDQNILKVGLYNTTSALKEGVKNLCGCRTPRQDIGA